MMSHVEVIEAFGGVRPLAEAIGVDPKLAIHWRSRGIPAKFWALVAATPLGRERGITALMLTDLPKRKSEAA